MLELVSRSQKKSRRFPGKWGVRLKSESDLFSRNLYPVISCRTAVISAPLSLWLSNGGFFSPVRCASWPAAPTWSPCPPPPPRTPPAGRRPMGEAPKTGWGCPGVCAWPVPTIVGCGGCCLEENWTPGWEKWREMLPWYWSLTDSSSESLNKNSNLHLNSRPRPKLF